MRGGLKFVYGLGTVLLVVAAVHWLRQAPSTPPAPPAPSTPAAKDELPPRRDLQLHPLPPSDIPRVIPAEPPAPRMVYAAAPWEQQIDRVLVSQAAVEIQAQQLQAVFHSLPAEGQVEAAGHLVNLTDDEHYRLGEILGDPKAPEEVLDILLMDLSSRPDAIRLPLLLHVARTPKHPLSQEALEELSFLLDAEWGQNWPAWEKAVTQALDAKPEAKP